LSRFTKEQWRRARYGTTYRFMARKSAQVAGERRFHDYDLDETIAAILFKSCRTLWWRKKRSRAVSTAFPARISNAGPSRPEFNVPQKLRTLRNVQSIFFWKFPSRDRWKIDCNSAKRTTTGYLSGISKTFACACIYDEIFHSYIAMIKSYVKESGI
jgi:hypothetical protein